MQIRLGLTSGIILAAVGVAGLAGGGILWNFQDVSLAWAARFQPWCC